MISKSVVDNYHSCVVAKIDCVVIRHSSLTKQSCPPFTLVIDIAAYMVFNNPM